MRDQIPMQSMAGTTWSVIAFNRAVVVDAESYKAT
jgi:hypothetical protein